MFQLIWNAETTLEGTDGSATFWHGTCTKTDLIWFQVSWQIVAGDPDADSVEHLSHDILPLKRVHIIKVSACLLPCFLIWLHQNQMEQLGLSYKQNQHLFMCTGH